jgi:hypothetical protein
LIKINTTNRLALRYLSLTFVLLFLLFTSFSQVHAHTSVVNSMTAVVSVNSSSATYEKTVGVTIKWTITLATGETTASTIYTYVYIKIVGQTAILTSATETYASYTNNTLITQTVAMYIDEDSLQGGYLEDGSDLLITGEIHNGSVSASNKLATKSITVDYGSLVSGGEEEEESVGWGWTEYILLISAGIGVAVITILALRFGQNKGWVPPLGLKAPRQRDTLDYGTHKTWATRYTARDKEVIEGRRKPGQFKDIVSPKRSMNRDRATPHRPTKKRGKYDPRVDWDRPPKK